MDWAGVPRRLGTAGPLRRQHCTCAEQSALVRYGRFALRRRHPFIGGQLVLMESSIAVWLNNEEGALFVPKATNEDRLRRTLVVNGREGQFHIAPAVCTAPTAG